MSEQQELIRRGLHVQQLTSDINKSGPDERATGKVSKEVAGYLEICPSGTSPRVVEGYVKQFGGDKARIERAISELWEDHRGNVEDDWAPVVKKKGKKKETKDAPAGPLGGGRGRGGPGGLGGGRGRGRSAPPAGGRGGGRPTQRENGAPHLDSTGRGTSIGPTSRQVPQQRPKPEPVASSGWSTNTTEQETIPSRSSAENGGADTAASSTNVAETQPRRVANAWARGAPHLSKPVPASSETLNDATEEGAIKPSSSPKREKGQVGWNQKAPASPSKGQTADWPAKAGATWGTGSPTKKSPTTVEPAEPVGNRDSAGSTWGQGAAETGKKTDWGVKSEPTGWATSGSPKRTAHVESASAWGVKKDEASEGAWSDRAPASTSAQSTPLAQPSAWAVKDKAPQPSGWGTTEKSVSDSSQATAWGIKDKSAPPPPPGWGESKEQPSSLGGSSTWAAK